MIDRERLGRDLADWFAESAKPQMPDYVDEILRTTAARRQRPRWAFLGGPWDPMFHPLPWRAREAAVGVILAVLLALLIVATIASLSGSQTSDPAKPMLGTDIPDGAQHGTIDTPLGPARWVHLSGDVQTLPQEPLMWPATWASVAGDAPFTHLDLEASTRWTSSDGMAWVHEPLDRPIAADSLLPHDGGGARWLMAWGPPGVWRSTDGKAWEPIDLSSVIPVGPAAVRWEVEPVYDMASTDDVTVVEVSARATEPFETLGWPLDPEPGHVSEREPGLIVFAGSEEWEIPERLLRFESKPDGMRVIEEADGSIVAELEGVAYADVLGWVRDGPPKVERHITLIDGDRLVPTFRLADFGDSGQSSLGTMLGTSDAILALVLATPLGPANVWRSEDGREWVDLGRWGLPDGASGGEFQMGASRGFFHVEYHGPNGVREKVWRSDDGLTWDVVVEDVPADSSLHELHSYGFLTQQWVGEDGVALLASGDGQSWEEMDLSAIGLTTGQSGFTGLGVVGDTVFIVFDGEGGQRDMWILSFDTVSE